MPLELGQPIVYGMAMFADAMRKGIAGTGRIVGIGPCNRDFGFEAAAGIRMTCDAIISNCMTRAGNRDRRRNSAFLPP